MPTLGSRNEAIFVLSSHPLWETYKAALLRFAEARESLEAAPEQDTAIQEAAAHDFREALQDCDDVQHQIMTLRRRTWI